MHLLGGEFLMQPIESCPCQSVLKNALWKQEDLFYGYDFYVVYKEKGLLEMRWWKEALLHKNIASGIFIVKAEGNSYVLFCSKDEANPANCVNQSSSTFLFNLLAQIADVNV